MSRTSIVSHTTLGHHIAIYLNYSPSKCFRMSLLSPCRITVHLYEIPHVLIHVTVVKCASEALITITQISKNFFT